MVDEQEVGRRVKASIIGVIRGTGEITQATVDTIATTVQTTLTQGGETGAAAAQLGVGAVKGAIDAVGDRQWPGRGDGGRHGGEGRGLRQPGGARPSGTPPRAP